MLNLVLKVTSQKRTSIIFVVPENTDMLVLNKKVVIKEDGKVKK